MVLHENWTEDSLFGAFLVLARIWVQIQVKKKKEKKKGEGSKAHYTGKLSCAVWASQMLILVAIFQPLKTPKHVYFKCLPRLLDGGQAASLPGLWNRENEQHKVQQWKLYPWEQQEGQPLPTEIITVCSIMYKVSVVGTGSWSHGCGKTVHREDRGVSGHTCLPRMLSI